MEMRKIKKILKYAGMMILTTFVLSAIVIIRKAVQYKITVNAAPYHPESGLLEGNPARYVDPFIGTGGFPPYTAGDDIPGASFPFGMVRLSPDTKFFLGSRLGDGNTVSTAGYYYGDNRLMGFSHTRLVGTGASDGGHFRVLPYNTDRAVKDYLSGKYPEFSHRNESACPGYYSLELPDRGIKAELTATEHTGVHRYTFDGSTEPRILIDVSSVLGNGRAEGGEVNIDTVRHEVSGSVKTFGSFSSRYGGIKVYFSAVFSSPFKNYCTWSDDLIDENETMAKGNQLGVCLAFDNDGEGCTVILKIGISYVSIENARLNRETETGSLDFGQTLAAAGVAWNGKLDLIEIDGGTEEQRKIFYTALYHCFQMPTLFNDVNGEYTGFDKQVHRTDGSRYFTDLSLWDTFRTIHPLYTLIAPDDQSDMLRSLVLMCRQGGVLPRWPSGCGYTGSMIGSSADIVIAESYLKGITDFDAETAYLAMRKAALAIDQPEHGFRPRGNMSDCLKYQYCPADLMSDAVSKTLEYAYADNAIGRLAGALGHFEDTSLFMAHSRFYMNIWNPGTQYFQPRNASGEFVKKFKPRLLVYLDPDNEYTDDYVEGSALQWRWALFFNGEGLVSLFRDKDYFVSELESFFGHSDPALGSFYPGPYYWHGNEPDIHAAYLFNYAGRPDLTQKWVRWILDNKYSPSYDGIDGDDDAGTLSAWYVFSSLGLYPVAGSDRYQLGAPLFKGARIKTGKGILTIVADNYSPGNKYVKRIWLNETLLDRTWISHSEIIPGATLRFEMSSEPFITDN